MTKVLIYFSKKVFSSCHLDDVWNNFDENQFDDNYNYDYEVAGIVSDTILEEHSSNELPNPVLSSKPDLVLDEDSIFEAIEGPNEIKSPVLIEKSNNVNEMKPLQTPKIANLARSETTIFNSPLTPMPSYVAMNTPNLKNELKRFGIKALPRKQAVRKLVEIYEYTHRNKLSRRSKSCTDLIQESSNLSKKIVMEQEETTKSILKPKKTKLKKTLSNIDALAKDKTKETAITNDIAVFETDDQIPLSQPQSQTNSLSQEEIKRVIFDFIRNNSELYDKVLNYEPLDFEGFFQQVKSLEKFKISTKTLMHILDEQCVTFTLKNMRSKISKIKSRKKN